MGTNLSGTGLEQTAGRRAPASLVSSHSVWQTVTSFINGMLEIVADRTLRRIETRELTDRDSAALLDMLQKPSAPNAALRKACRRLRESGRG